LSSWASTGAPPDPVPPPRPAVDAARYGVDDLVGVVSHHRRTEVVVAADAVAVDALRADEEGVETDGGEVRSRAVDRERTDDRIGRQRVTREGFGQLAAGLTHADKGDFHVIYSTCRTISVVPVTRYAALISLERTHFLGPTTVHD